MEYTKYMIAIPCGDMMHTTFVASLTNMKRVGATRVTFFSGSLVYDARNALAAEAIDTGADRVLWIDSDMQFDRDMMERLAADMDEGRDFVCGLCFKRTLPTVPVIAKHVELDGEEKTVTYTDYPRDQVFEVARAGFGACMMTTKMLKDIWDNYGKPFYPMNGHGEDYSFCERAYQLGYKLYCDSRIKVGHTGIHIYGEKDYLID